MKRWRPRTDGVRANSAQIAGVALLVAAALAVDIHAAHAQFAGSATVETQYDVRGATLDYGRPDGRLSLSYDLANGVYTGVSGTIGDTPDDGVMLLGYTGYVGYAWRGHGGLSWDVGLDDLDVTLHPPAPSRDGALVSPVSTPARPHVRYAEAYAGVSWHDLSVRLFLSPDYLRDGAHTAYFDINQGVRLTNRLRLYAHGGALTPLPGSSAGPPTDRERFDIGAGAMWVFPRSQLQLGWTDTAPQSDSQGLYHERRSKLTFSATAFF